MIKKKRVLGLVLARGGSKGLPGKNIKVLNGKPLIAWSILCGLNSVYIDDLVVSTDSSDIATLSRKYGAEVPFLRPDYLASDEASSVDAMLHAIDWLKNCGRTYEYVVLLEPTSPLREAHDIDQALTLLEEKKGTSVVSVCRAESTHPSFMFEIIDQIILKPCAGKYPNALRRQDIPPVFFLEGTIYCADIESLREQKGFYHSDTLAYIVPKWKSLEIDDADDFVMVEAIMNARGIK